MFHKIELLAPAGDLRAFKAAMLAGADSVYISGKRFGARAFAPNFDENALLLARRATLHLNRKLYVTLNTIVFDHEWPLLEKTIEFFRVLQPDAIIVQDIGVAVQIRKMCCSIPIHLSTQAAWFGVGGCDQLEELGVTRIILPREMSLKQIRQVTAGIPFETEVFVHGAMCYSISGRCFWSVALGSRSGNRGTCAQPCRKQYYLEDDGSGGHIFSPRDLKLYAHLEELRRAKVTSVKIEGRMKSAEYVFKVVSAYRTALDGKKSSDSSLMFGEAFARSSHTGFFNGTPDNWNTPFNPGREKVKIGTIKRRLQNGLSEIILESGKTIHQGDGIVWDLHKDLASQANNRNYDCLDTGKTGTRITYVEFPPDTPGICRVRGLPAMLPLDTKLYRTDLAGEISWESQWRKEWEKYPIDLFWSGHEGQPLALETRINGHALRLTSEEPLSLSLMCGLDEGPLEEKFRSLGDVFCAKRHVTKALDRKLFVSPTALKKLKRSFVETIKLLEKLPPPCEVSELFDRESVHAGSSMEKNSDNHFEASIALRIWNKSFPFFRDIRPDIWILPWMGRNNLPPRFTEVKIAYWLPPVTQNEQLETLINSLHLFPPHEFWCLGWEAFELKKRLSHHRFRLDWPFNIANRHAVDFVAESGLTCVASREWAGTESVGDADVFLPLAWNPLISLSLFPGASVEGKAVLNSHKDRFFTLDLGNKVTGLFLAEKITTLPFSGKKSVQIDIALDPSDNPIKVASALSSMVENFRAGKFRQI